MAPPHIKFSRIALAFLLFPPLLAARNIRTTKDLEFYEIVAFDRPAQYLGFSSSKLENVVEVPFGQTWFIRPDGAMNEERYEALFAEIKEHRYPGFDVSNRWDVSDKTLEGLQGCQHLRILRLAETKITDAGLSVLEHLPQLENLSVSNQTTDKGLARIGKLKNLKTLDVHRSRITDKGLLVLKDLPKLESLDLSGTAITDNGAKILASFKKLKQLDISGTDVSDRGIAHLAELPRLEVLYASARLSNRGLVSIGRMKHLRSLDVSRSRITDHGAPALKALLRLEALALSDVSISDETLYTVAELKKLQTLELSGTRVTSHGLLLLQKLPRLETLSLGWTSVSSAEWHALGSLPQVSRVILNGRSVGQDVLTRIRKLAAQHKAMTKTALVPRPMRPATPVPKPKQVKAQQQKPAVKQKTSRPGIAGPKELPASLQQSPPDIKTDESIGKGMTIEVAATPRRRTLERGQGLTGLKRLHQIEMSDKPRELELSDGAMPVIPSSEPDPKNSLGEITVEAR